MKNLSDLLILFGLFILCSAVGQFFVLFSLALWYDIPATESTIKRLLDIQYILQHKDGAWIVYYMQGVISLCGLVLSSWVFLRFFAKPKHSLNTNSLQIRQVGLTALMMLTVIPCVSWLVWMNGNVQLPEFLSSFETAMREKASSSQILTNVLTRFPTFLHFFVAIVVIAVIPAIGEELWFRGLLQRKMAGLVSPHVAIWVASLVFGIAHFDFFKLIPLTILGALFGYLYYWSGNLWITITAHFLNNFITLLAIYLYNQRIVTHNFYEPSPVAWYWVLVSIGATSLLVYAFKQNSQPSKI